MSRCSAEFLGPEGIEPACPWIESAQQVLIWARRIHRRLAAEAKRHGLGKAEIEMLWACAKAPPGGRSQNELADDLAVSPGHVSGVIERLGCAGLLQCSMVEGDRRLRLWQLTPAGWAIWKTFLDDSTQHGEAT